MEIGQLLGYISPAFGAVTSEKSGNPSNNISCIWFWISGWNCWRGSSLIGISRERHL